MDDLAQPLAKAIAKEITEYLDDVGDFAKYFRTSFNPKAGREAELERIILKHIGKAYGNGSTDNSSQSAGELALLA